MRIIFVLFIAIFAFAKIDAKIVSVNKDEALINKNVKTGISGIVVCPYMDEKIICARAVAFGKKVKFYNFETLQNDAFALPVVMPKSGDEIVFAKDYNRIMIIAPTQDIYLMLKNRYQKNGNIIISPDVFAAFLDDMPTIENFRNFAKIMNIGRFVFAVNDKIYEVDSYSFYVINSHQIQKKALYKKAFFTYFSNFDIKTKNIQNYYLHLLKGLK
jgi:hypothetical protein